MRLAPLSLPLLLALLAGSGAAHDGHALVVSDLAFTHHVREGSGGTPVTLASTYSFDVANALDRDVADVTAVIYLGSLQPSLGLQMRAPLGTLEAGETRHVEIERNAVPAPYYCVQLQAPGGLDSEAACAVADGYTLP